MAEAPVVSVIVCTRDRPDDLRRALKSLSAQDFVDYEVIVVDQSRGPETRRVVRDATIGPVRYVHLGVPGLSRAYNTGIHLARGELLAFTDDDCIAPASWLRFVVAAFESDLGVSLVYGQVLLPPGLKERDGQDGVTPQLPIPQRRRLSKRDGFRVFGMGANFAARRSVCLELGGFDEVLGGGGPLQSAQDFDFAYRLFRQGHAILLEPTVIVFHHGFRSMGEWPTVVRSYGIGVGGFYWKHVRAGDLYAARKLVGTLLRESAGVARKVLLRKPAASQWRYVTSVGAGIVRSHEFAVDGGRRLYRAPDRALTAG